MAVQNRFIQARAGYQIRRGAIRAHHRKNVWHELYGRRHQF